MATYQELHALTHNAEILNRIMAAVAILADEIRTELPATANHAERMAWAKRALTNVDGTARGLMWVVMAQNRTFTVAQIDGATDAALQTAVNSAVELLI
jgi:hypothetical protein